jgi:hypothetical protein
MHWCARDNTGRHNAEYERLSDQPGSARRPFITTFLVLRCLIDLGCVTAQLDITVRWLCVGCVRSGFEIIRNYPVTKLGRRPGLGSIPVLNYQCMSL